MHFLKSVRQVTKREFIGNVTAYSGAGRFAVTVNNKTVTARADGTDCSPGDMVMVRTAGNEALIVRKLGSYETDITEERIDA